MQTFLPYPDFDKSASLLDTKRLGKQRVENLQILTALLEGKGWIHHPATLMWKGYIPALTKYHYAICLQWILRGYVDNCYRKFREILKRHDLEVDLPQDVPIPPWMGDEDLHRGYRSSLLRKDWDHYVDLFERDLPTDLPYIWPIDRMFTERTKPCKSVRSSSSVLDSLSPQEWASLLGAQLSV